MSYNKSLETQYVSSSFHKLLQISSSENVILDGTGSEVILVVTGSFTGDGSGLVNVPGVSGQYELELMLKDTQKNYYKELTFISNTLATISLWDNNSKDTLIFDKRFEYTGSGVLSSFVTTRYSDMRTLTKDFSYDGSGNLINIEVEDN